ncbi:MAG: sulfotransferase domain-containing protein [bacterium]|nr:sulfotransferase domain-containing protein [bacterium]
MSFEPTTGRAGRLPDFLIGGAQKSGTTALHRLLDQHRRIFFPPRPQELDFFDAEESHGRGLAWYRRHFAGAGSDHGAVGQTSTQYLYASGAAERIARDLPEAKLIFILRDPVERAWAHYWHCVKYGVETESFADARRLEAERIARGGRELRFFSYLDRGLYARQLERFLERFERARILVLLTEELGGRPGTLVDRCCAFLGVEPISAEIGPEMLARRWNAARLPRLPRLQRWTARFRFDSAAGRGLARMVDRVNLARRPYPEMAAGERADLRDHFADENRRLAEMLDLDLSAWQSRAEP